MQEELSSLQAPVNIMQIQIHDQADANFPVKVLGVNVVTLYGMGINMSCMSYVCYVKLKDRLMLKMVPAMSVHSAIGHDLYPVGLIYCKVTIGKSI